LRIQASLAEDQFRPDLKDTKLGGCNSTICRNRPGENRTWCSEVGVTSCNVGDILLALRRRDVRQLGLQPCCGLGLNYPTIIIEHPTTRLIGVREVYRLHGLKQLVKLSWSYGSR